MFPKGNEWIQSNDLHVELALQLELAEHHSQNLYGIWTETSLLTYVDKASKRNRTIWFFFSMRSANHLIETGHCSTCRHFSFLIPDSCSYNNCLLSTSLSCWCPTVLQEIWTQLLLKVRSNSNNSMILWQFLKSFWMYRWSILAKDLYENSAQPL